MKNTDITVSQQDIDHLAIIRANVSDFMSSWSKKLDGVDVSILDIAPQDHEGARVAFSKACIQTLDIDPKSGANYILDICNNNSETISDNQFDVVVCTEVLEHTLNPFKAVEEIHRILKPGGHTLVTVPFNFRIHGPLPDCWRFTEHGLRALFHGKFQITELIATETVGRDLMPIQYSLVAQKINIRERVL